MAVAAIIFMFAGCNPEEVNSPVFPNTLDTVHTDSIPAASEGVFSVSPKRFVKFATFVKYRM